MRSRARTGRASAARRHLALAAWLLALALGACARAPAPPGAAWLELSPGTTVEHAGLVLIAPEGALSAPIRVRIERSVEGFDDTAFPSGIEPLGPQWRVSAETGVFPDVAAPFLVGLPVPTDRPPEGLALAVLEQGLRHPLWDDDDDAPVGAAEWSYLEAIHDASLGVVLNALYHLDAEPAVLALAAHPAFEVERVVDAAASGVEPRQLPAPSFAARCVAAFWTFPVPEACHGTPVPDLVAATLGEGYHQLVDAGFTPLPRLRRSLSVRRSATGTLRPVFGPYVVDLHPASMDSFGGLGVYRWRTASIAVKVFAGEPPVPYADVVRHEYVHAVQMAYTDETHGSFLLYFDTMWVVEGQAALLERSYTPLMPTWRALMEVDRAFEQFPYRSGDFWAYLAFRFEHGAGFLVPFLEERGRLSATEVDRALRRHYDAFAPPGFSGLNRAYWEWARNQAFEQTVDMRRPSAYGESCTANENAVNTLHALSHVAGAAPSARAFTLPPLTSRLVKIEMHVPGSGSHRFALGVTTSRPIHTRAKLYAERSGEAVCVADPEGLQYVLDVDEASTEERYLLISNTSLAFPIDVTVAFAGLTITSPTAGARFDEGDPISFRADLLGGGMDPAATTVFWSVDRFDGVPFTFGSSAPGETLLAAPLCDGTWTVTATAHDIATDVIRSTSVDVVVNDLGATNPPPQCAPSVGIVEPIDGTGVPFGETLTLVAHYDDGQPGTTDPKYPLVWRLGDENGAFLGQGPTLDVTLPLGEHVIHVSYGSASDVVGVTVVDAPGPPPTANIFSPEDGQEFAWSDDPSTPNAEVPLNGLGLSLTHGVIAGPDHRWYARPAGGVWSFVGSGTTVLLTVPPVCDAPSTPYDVRLVVTDPDGLSGYEEVRVVITHLPC